MLRKISSVKQSTTTDSSPDEFINSYVSKNFDKIREKDLVMRLRGEIRLTNNEIKKIKQFLKTNNKEAHPKQEKELFELEKKLYGNRILLSKLVGKASRYGIAFAITPKSIKVTTIISGLISIALMSAAILYFANNSNRETSSANAKGNTVLENTQKTDNLNKVIDALDSKKSLDEFTKYITTDKDYQVQVNLLEIKDKTKILANTLINNENDMKKLLENRKKINDDTTLADDVKQELLAKLDQKIQALKDIEAAKKKNNTITTTQIQRQDNNPAYTLAFNKITDLNSKIASIYNSANTESLDSLNKAIEDIGTAKNEVILELNKIQGIDKNALFRKIDPNKYLDDLISMRDSLNNRITK